MSIQELKEIISNSQNIVFFGGAGVSTESNIPDFRSEDGIYNTVKKYGHPPEEILSHSFFMKNTQTFYEYYKNQMLFSESKPNKAHLALAQLEKSGKLKAVITQNIDGLHHMAGSQTVIELHGSVYRNHCMKCGEFYDLKYITGSENIVPKCSKCGGIIKPEVTLYEEVLDENVLKDSIQYISKADVLIVGGTSLVVYPAAGLIDYFKGSKLILINRSSTKYDKKADLVINQSIGEVFEGVMDGLL